MYIDLKKIKELTSDGGPLAGIVQDLIATVLKGDISSTGYVIAVSTLTQEGIMKAEAKSVSEAGAVKLDNIFKENRKLKLKAPDNTADAQSFMTVSPHHRMMMIEKGYNPLNPEDVKGYYSDLPPVGDSKILGGEHIKNMGQANEDERKSSVQVAIMLEEQNDEEN
jgi:hypothetical protein